MSEQPTIQDVQALLHELADRLPGFDLETFVRAIVREQLRAEVEESREIVDVKQHMRVSALASDGKRWRGVLYMEESEGEK